MTRDYETAGLRDGQSPEVTRPEVPKSKTEQLNDLQLNN